MAVRAKEKAGIHSCLTPATGGVMIFPSPVCGRRTRLSARALVLGALLSLAADRGFAATITVNTTTDENGTGPACSLREAIASANNDVDTGGCVGSGAYNDDTILVPAGTYSTTAQLTVGDTTPNNLVITGAGAAATFVEGTASTRVFEITKGNFSVSGVTIRNGHAVEGAGIFFNSATGTTLTISDCE